MFRVESAPPTLQVFFDRLRRIVGDRFDEALAGLSTKRGIALRANTFRTSPEALRATLESLGFGLEPIPWCPGGFYLRSGDSRALGSSGPARRGELYVQNVSSMIPPLALDLAFGQRVLDIAAAPGGKTTQIASLLGGTGEVVANDRSPKRFYRLRAVLRMQGTPNVSATCFPGENYGYTHPEHFDRVQVDAPCSGEGRFVLSEPSTWTDWSIEKVHRCARIQRRLLRSGLKALKEGGILVYSTCTFSPEENEAIVQDALDGYRGAVELEEIPVQPGGTLGGLQAWEGRQFDPEMAKCMRVLPDAYRVGFFVARLRKVRRFEGAWLRPRKQQG